MKVPVAILSIFFFAVGCLNSAKKNALPVAETDTAKLFDPYPQKDSLVETGAVLCNCVMLENTKRMASIGCEKISLQTDDQLLELLKQRVAHITKQKFYIVYSDSTSTQRIIDVIGLVKEAKIDDYKVMSLKGLFHLNPVPPLNF